MSVISHRESRPAGKRVEASTHPCRLRLIAPSTEPETYDSPPKLWFAILTFNALAYSKRCLASLDRYTTEPWRAVILDNLSTDGTRDWLASLDDPRVSTELGDANLGVAGGRNRLLELMLDRIPDDGWIIFIDNDLEFYPGWATPFLELFARQPNAGIASCSGHEIVVHGDRRELLSLPGHAAIQVDVASGGFACFVRPAVFRDIGRYDEALNPFWHEDDDISVRALVAGWDVYALPTAPVIHHGHKSGVALPALVQGGSLDKQRYLVEKWRAQGLVQPDGRLAYGRERGDVALAVALQHRLQRRGPLRQSEVDRARADIALLLHAAGEHGDIAVAARYASAPAKTMLDQRVESGHASSLELRLLQSIQTLLDARRRTSRLPVRIGERSTTLSRLADAQDWDDPVWFATAVEFAGDGRGEQQWYDRTLATWRTTQAAFTLRACGALRSDARLLIVSDLRAPLVWGLARHVAQVVVADVLDRYSGHDGSDWLAAPERFATQAAPAGRVRAVAIEALTRDVTPEPFDAAVVLPFDNSLAATEIGAMLSLAASCVKPGGLLLSCAPIRLAGPPQPHALDGLNGVPRWLAARGLTPYGDIDGSMSDLGLLAATDRAHRDRRTPDLLIADGPQLTGHLFIVSTTDTAGAPAT